VQERPRTTEFELLVAISVVCSCFISALEYGLDSGLFRSIFVIRGRNLFGTVLLQHLHRHSVILVAGVRTGQLSTCSCRD